MSVSLDLFDQLIAETEQRLSEQHYRVMVLELAEEDATSASRKLRALKGILVEYRYARRLVAEAQRLRDDALPKG